MASFALTISKHAPSAADRTKRRWVYIPYDRYTDRVGPLTEQVPEKTAIVIVESTAKAMRRPYHKKKLILLISNMRHFALEQAAKGVKVLYHFSPGSHGQALLELQGDGRIPEALTCIVPAERELRLDLAQARADGLKLEQVEDPTWASQTADFTSVYGPWRAGRSYVMDRFYRAMRQKTGVLMVAKGKPLGGNYSYDADNRSPYKNEVPVPQPPRFPADAVTREVMAMVEEVYGDHFGSGEGFDLPCTQAEHDELWRFFLAEMLPHFGRFEDAMRDDHLQLFHSKTSASLNLGRILAMDLVRDAERAAAKGAVPLASAEGFIRQLLGWREFMRHLHEQTDGYRLLAGSVPQQKTPPPQPDSPYNGACPSALGADRPLPAAYWGVKSGLHCLDTVVAQVLTEGWSHHIPRLMVLSNLAVLCGFSPRELTDWFWIAYVDAYDWVVEPNVLGMATYGDGGMTATKPYVSGAAYINRMSNYCGHCQYDPRKSTGEGSCPFTALYWTFLERNRERLEGNIRMKMPYVTLERKPEAEMVALRARAAAAIEELAAAPRPTY